jgi:hypothetical protein
LKKPFVFLGVAFAISLGANVYLFKLVADWQEAWLEQTLTTAEIERLYRNSGADVSFESIKSLIERVKSQYEVTPVDRDGSLLFPADKEAILLNGTRLYFKDGQYIGSKANLPEGLVHWKLGQDEF